jgi:hypothetical protein
MANRWVAVLLVSILTFVAGCVVVTPRPAAVWVPGHYQTRTVWVPGHYR